MTSEAGAQTPTYGDAARRLEAILETIEQGRVDIDELSGLVAEAADLVKLCRDKIQAAEVQVKRITEDLDRAGEEVAAPPPPGPPAYLSAPPLPDAPPYSDPGPGPGPGSLSEDDIPF